MTKTISYVCKLCDTLVHNCSCACGNVATIVSDKSIQLFVDDLATVEAIHSYKSVSGEIKYLDYLSSKPTSSITSTKSYYKSMLDLA